MTDATNRARLLRIADRLGQVSAASAEADECREHGIEHRLTKPGHHRFDPAHPAPGARGARSRGGGSQGLEPRRERPEEDPAEEAAADEAIADAEARVAMLKKAKADAEAEARAAEQAVARVPRAGVGRGSAGFAEAAEAAERRVAAAAEAAV